MKITEFQEDGTTARIKAVLRSRKAPHLLFDRKETEIAVIDNFIPQKISYYGGDVTKIKIRRTLPFTERGSLTYKGHYGPRKNEPKKQTGIHTYTGISLERHPDYRLLVDKVVFNLPGEKTKRSYERVILEVPNMVTLVLATGQPFVYR